MAKKRSAADRSDRDAQPSRTGSGRASVERLVVDHVAAKPWLWIAHRRPEMPRSRETDGAEPARVDAQPLRVRAHVRDRGLDVTSGVARRPQLVVGADVERDRAQAACGDQLRPADLLAAPPTEAGRPAEKDGRQATASVSRSVDVHPQARRLRVHDVAVHPGPVHARDLEDDGLPGRRVPISVRGRDGDERDGEDRERGLHERCSSSRRISSVQRIHASACAMPQRSVT